MIHDDLRRRFEGRPTPVLSREFSMNLRRRLRSDEPPRLRRSRWLTWAIRLYWVAAALLLVWSWRPVELTGIQLAVLVAVGAMIALTLRRATRPGPLTRVLRQMWK